MTPTTSRRGVVSDPPRFLRNSHAYLGLGLFAAAALAVWLYAPTLSMPLIYDSLLHTQLADDLTWRSVWLPSERFGFYRPLVFVPFLLLQGPTGSYPAGLLHALSVGLHAGNVLLAGMLVWRLWGRPFTAVLTSFLLAAFPFAYQAVAVVGNNAYPAVTAVLLLGTHTHLAYLRTERKRWQAATLLIALAGLLIHETAVLLLPLVLMVGVIHEDRHDVGRMWRPTVPLAGLIGAYLLVYFLFLPTGGGPQLDYGGNDPVRKLLLLGQTAAYPLLWLSNFVWPDGGTAVSVGFMAAAVLLVGGIYYQRPESRPLILFGFGWWMLTAVLIGVTLPTYYIADGARLLYPGAVGPAVGWAAVMVSLPLRRMAVGLMAAVIFTSSLFVMQMVDLYARVSAPVADMAAVMADRPADEGVVVVNLPQWMAPLQETYEFGTEYAPFMGDHLFVQELIRANIGHQRPVFALSAPGLRAERADYHYGVYEQFAVSALTAEALTAPVYHLFVHRYEPDHIRAVYRGRIRPAATLSQTTAAISGYRLGQVEAVWCDEQLTVTMPLTVAEGASIPDTGSFFVQALGADGRLVGQNDGPPLGVPAARMPLSSAVVLEDVRPVTGAAGLGPISARPQTVLVGVYDYTTGERFPAVDATGETWPDAAVRVPVRDCTP